MPSAADGRDRLPRLSHLPEERLWRPRSRRCARSAARSRSRSSPRPDRGRQRAEGVSTLRRDGLRNPRARDEWAPARRRASPTNARHDSTVRREPWPGRARGFGSSQVRAARAALQVRRFAPAGRSQAGGWEVAQPECANYRQPRERRTRSARSARTREPGSDRPPHDFSGGCAARSGHGSPRTVRSRRRHRRSDPHRRHDARSARRVCRAGRCRRPEKRAAGRSGGSVALHPARTTRDWRSGDPSSRSRPSRPEARFTGRRSPRARSEWAPARRASLRRRARRDRTIRREP